MNQNYLMKDEFSQFGFQFSFAFNGEADQNLMVLTRPCFLFGSDLTHQFQGAMVSESVIMLVPENVPAPFLFCPAEYALFYMKNPDYLYQIASPRTLGRGMICLDMDDIDNLVTFSTIAVSAPSIKSVMANLDASTYADIQEKLNNGVISITCK